MPDGPGRIGQPAEAWADTLTAAAPGHAAVAADETGTAVAATQADVAAHEANAHMTGTRAQTEAAPDMAGPAAAAAAAAGPAQVLAPEDRQLDYAAVTGEPSFDPIHNSRFRWQVIRRSLLLIPLAVVAESVIAIFSLIVGATGAGFGSVFTPLTVLASLALLLLYLLLPVPALLAQWSLLIDFKAATAPAVFESISQALDRHATPLDTRRVRTISAPGEERREYLELRRGAFASFISCFPHGRDLYVGWTFWIYMSPLRLLIMVIGRRVQNITGRGNDMYVTLRYESARATIAAIHSTALEGIDVAIAVPGRPLSRSGFEFEIS